MIGIVAYTQKPFKGIHTLAARYRQVLPGSEIISVDDQHNKYFIKNIDTINENFKSLIFIEQHFDRNLVKKFKGKMFLVPMWEFIGSAAPLFDRLHGTICHSKKALETVSKIIRCPHHLVNYPMLKMNVQNSDKNITEFFMINGHPGKNRKRPDLLNAANTDNKYRINILTIKNLSSSFEHLNVIEGFVEDRKDLYKHGQMQLYPSVTEGLGMAIYEALEYGIPTVIADVAPVNEDYNKELLIAPDSAQAIRRAMDKFYNQGSSELKKWIDHFIDQRSAKRFVDHVLNII
jgi:hypothetical protein